MPAVFRRLRCISQTTLRHLQDFFLEVGPEFLRIVGIVRFAETFRKFPFVLLGNALVPEPADIQPNSVGWRHLTRLEPYFQGSHEKSVVGPGKLGAPKDPTVLDTSPATAYKYMVSFDLCRIANNSPILDSFIMFQFICSWCEVLPCFLVQYCVSLSQ